ncbi:MAG: 30S ribosomal protein S11 [Candidatus Buchananbacteria bacterium]|nr:30S ribosomal protein S11 [Candidatus Buchananbacteria bacterium]
MTETSNQQSNQEPVVEKADQKEEATAVKTSVSTKGRKSKVKKQVPTGRVYIQATYNNTVVSVTDATGNALAQCSAGQAGFKGPKKSTPYAAGVIVKKVTEKIQPYGLREVSVFVKGIGGGREAAIRALNANGIQVLSIKDVTPIPHNGPRPRKPRRV